ncbi:hypothetical protein NLU13_7145 [Sarocladium strictum]|uniref:Transmembrane protein n=1 Tax=Sarocladium strictum TaxID=5046 RepID=A0AA39GF28_SARSR|nr:hypothetical protein NLU13_7145 [Sarocladium strictum]
MDADLNQEPLQAVCAWPLSGQYGTGSRVLFYVLVTACIVARKYEWLRDACLAAVLLLPAVAALHGIIIAAVHQDGAVDMDIYGAFQLCAIGILAAPVTVRLSQTYFDKPGRNAIFLWTGIIVAGLMSLSIESYRAVPKPCGDRESFEYGKVWRCGLNCSLIESPIRTGSVDNIYVTPEPVILTFGTATLLNAALCVHAILWLLSMLDKILEESSSKYRKRTRPSSGDHDPIEGTNGATRSGMERINDMVKRCLNVAAVPVFMAAGLAILIVGERNFFSKQMSYQTEPISSVGQWAPIAAASLAVIGSLYLVLAKDMDRLAKEADTEQCECAHCHVLHPLATLLSPSASLDANNRYHEHRPRPPESAQNPTNGLEHVDTSVDLSRTTSRPVTSDAGRRRTVAQAFMKASKVLGMAAREWTDDSDFQRGRAQDWPEIPGEPNRNRDLSRIRIQYNKPRDENGNVTPAGPSRSRASSSVDSFRPRTGHDTPPRDTADRSSISALGPTLKVTTSQLRKSASAVPGTDEAHVEFREFTRSPAHVEQLLEVPRSALLTTRTGHGGRGHDPDQVAL